MAGDEIGDAAIGGEAEMKCACSTILCARLCGGARRGENEAEHGTVQAAGITDGSDALVAQDLLHAVA